MRNLNLLLESSVRKGWLLEGDMCIFRRYLGIKRSGVVEAWKASSVFRYLKMEALMLPG
jgi:hypothetical protein